jgi:acyl-CoA synthetase (AMP-forming)/AMP-acid ligase II
MAGGTVVLGDVEGRTLAERVAEQGITVVVATPSVCRGLVSSPEGPPDGAALRLAVCLSGPVDRAVHLELERRYDALVVEGYGRVEATCAALANPYTGRRKPGSLGLPLPEESCRIVDHEGCDLAAGSTGEIVLRGPNIMSGYLDDPARSREALRDGWLHTGDSGHVDGDGYYYLAPRPIPCSG